MKIHRSLSIGLFVATTLAVAVVNTSAGAGRDETIKLNGCLIKAEGDNDYLITNLPSEPSSSTSADRRVTTTAIGTASNFTNVFYWLGGDDDLKKHVGHRVEIDGELKGDIKEGQIKLDRKDNWTELEVKSDGHEMKAKVPNAYMFTEPNRDKDRKISALVRKVDVNHVHMLSATCQ
jgi:hypothetical protein